MDSFRRSKLYTCLVLFRRNSSFKIFCGGGGVRAGKATSPLVPVIAGAVTKPSLLDDADEEAIGNSIPQA